MSGYYTFIPWKKQGPYKDAIIPRWNCEHMKDETPILIFKHKPIYDIPTREWIENRYICPCKICRTMNEHFITKNEELANLKKRE